MRDLFKCYILIFIANIKWSAFDNCNTLPGATMVWLNYIHLNKKSWTNRNFITNVRSLGKIHNLLIYSVLFKYVAKRSRISGYNSRKIWYWKSLSWFATCHHFYLLIFQLLRWIEQINLVLILFDLFVLSHFIFLTVILYFFSFVQLVFSWYYFIFGSSHVFLAIINYRILSFHYRRT